MTTPNERTRALCQAGELLQEPQERQERQERQDSPQDMRTRLKGVLRHSPEEWQLYLMAEEWQRLRCGSFGLAPELDQPDPLQPQETRPR